MGKFDKEMLEKAKLSLKLRKLDRRYCDLEGGERMKTTKYLGHPSPGYGETLINLYY